MTFHAPQSRAGLVAAIAGRMIFRKSNLVAVGAIASASAVFAARDIPSESVSTTRTIATKASIPHKGERLLEPASIRIASLAPAALPDALARHGGDTARPPMRIDVRRPARLASPVELSSPLPDWSLLNDTMDPRLPDLGPVPLTPRGPGATASDTLPKIDRRPEGRLVESTVARSGESLEDLLIRIGVHEDDRQATIVALRADNLNDVMTGNERVDAAFSGDGSMLLGLRMTASEGVEPVEVRWDGETDPLWALLELDSSESILATEALIDTGDGAGSFSATADGGSTAFVSGQITSSLYGAAEKAGMTARDIQRLSNLFRYIVDFERDLRKGDSFEVLFAKDTSGNFSDILYAKLTNRGSEIALYRGQNEFGESGYYDATGRSNKRALMRTPIAGAEVSSSFGMRMHPILGYNKMHRGVDFRAPTGTPIFAAGDGVVDYAGWRGSAGKYIRIRHSSSYKTAYAHLSRVASHVQPGRRVKQGEVIGYVGTTGRSTGPHLHFEIIENGERINPMQVADFGSINGLEGPLLSSFKAQVARIEVSIGLLHENRVASAQ